MADNGSKVPPRRKGGASSRAATKTASRPAPPRPPNRKRPTKRGRRGGQNRLIYGVIVVVVAIIVAIVAYELTSSGSSKTSKAQPHQPAVGYSVNGAKVYGTLGPENVPIELGAPLAAANTGLTGSPIDGIQCGGEQVAYHHHAHVAIFIDGQPRSVPLGVGMVPPALVQQDPQHKSNPEYDFAEGSNTCLYWLHVHAQDGIVHIESPIAKTFELGQVFDIWHQALSSTQIGPYTGKVTATVNGTPWTGNPAQILLNEHTQIVLNLGGPAVTPPPISWSGTGL